MSAFSLRHRADPLRPPEAPGLGRGFAFAVLAHALLLLALSASVQWRTKTLPTFEAELWSAVPQAAAPKAVEPPPQPEPEPPKPTPKPQPPAEDLQAQRDAEIAIAKAREQKKKEDAELLAERKKQQALKDQQDKLERDKQEQAKQDKLEKQKLEKLKQEKLDKANKEAEAKREDLRKENLRRIQGMAGASGGPNATGSALKSSGPSSSYGGRIVARVRPNIIYDPGAGNPVAEVEVRAAPDGTIVGKKLVKRSGDDEWDKAVLRAIDKTEILPRDVDGTVPSTIVITFRPRD
jgi:colicin import membrane protein